MHPYIFAIVISGTMNIKFNKDKSENGNNLDVKAQKSEKIFNYLIFSFFLY